MIMAVSQHQVDKWWAVDSVSLTGQQNVRTGVEYYSGKLKERPPSRRDSKLLLYTHCVIVKVLVNEVI